MKILETNCIDNWHNTFALRSPTFWYPLCLMLLVGSLTCKTVSRVTYTVLVETLNPIHSLQYGGTPYCIRSG